MAKITGSFCERTETPKRAFDKRSFRWKQSGSAGPGGPAAWILVGCPKGGWDARRARCRRGLRAYKILAKAPRGRCRAGRKIKKG